MIEAYIDPDDLRELTLDLARLKPENLLKGELLHFATTVGITAGKYAPNFPGNTYVRTGHLGRSWYSHALGDLAAEVGNLAIYAGWVHGPQQVAIHRAHGWRRLFEMGEEMLDDFVKKIADRAGEIWQSKNM